MSFGRACFKSSGDSSILQKPDLKDKRDVAVTSQKCLAFQNYGHRMLHFLSGPHFYVFNMSIRTDMTMHLETMMKFNCKVSKS